MPPPPPDDSAARVPLGPIGGYVIANLTEIRAARRLTYKQLADRLEQLGRPIPTLGLSRIEKGNRRVDADDLVALAIALEVNPSALLLPRTTDASEETELTPGTRVAAATAWRWADGRIPLWLRQTDVTEHAQADFEKYARPSWDPAAYGPAAPIFRQIRSTQLDDLQRQLDELRAVTRPVAAAIITSPLGVLITQRRDGQPPYGFLTGELEPGESAEAAAVREAKEEAGLIVTASGIIGERVHPATARHMIYMAAHPVYGTDAHVGDESELEAVRWVSLTEALDLMPTMYEPVREYLAREIGGQQ